VLTKKQIESLLSYMKVTRGEMHLREAAVQRSDRPVTVGSYYRTVQQARRKVKASVVTLAIAVATGVVRVEDMRRLFDLVGKSSVELSDEEAERFVVVFRALLGKIVM
jgi:hypothetical protein